MLACTNLVESMPDLPGHGDLIGRTLKPSGDRDSQSADTDRLYGARRVNAALREDWNAELRGLFE